MLAVKVKNAGKTYDVQLDPTLPGKAFKEAVYQVTGVPPERMKVMIKGGLLKDDSDWTKSAPKAGQTFMVIGAAGELPKPPPEPVVFLEDMDDSELAEALAVPVGLVNLGNTCYMNATVQALRAVPELQQALKTYEGGQGQQAQLTKLLGDSYTQMGKSTDEYSPFFFLQMLRQVVPRFGETASVGKGMQGYAQQDAEECWSAILESLMVLKGQSADGGTPSKSLVEQYMMGEMRRELKCDEDPEEPSSVSTERVSKISCNITKDTNYMHTGILASLDEKVEKNSPKLGRNAVYTAKSRLSRLPANLAVHMVRFAWRQDIGKKTKIMRKVKFPTEFDALDLVTDELKEKLMPVNSRLKAIDKDRGERRKVRKRTKVKKLDTEAASASASVAATGSTDVEMADGNTATPAAAGPAPGDVEDETVARKRELEELEGLVNVDLKADIGSSVHGIYDLVAIVTHKGPAADSGHYIGFVKKSVFHPPPEGTYPDDVDEDWYKFDDNKVSPFPKEKLATLDGGGEDSSAYVLLYRSKPLA